MLANASKHRHKSSGEAVMGLCTARGNQRLTLLASGSSQDESLQLLVVQEGLAVTHDGDAEEKGDQVNTHVEDVLQPPAQGPAQQALHECSLHTRKYSKIKEKLILGSASDKPILSGISCGVHSDAGHCRKCFCVVA